eukprot:jgi/Mesvir1/15590/Mv03205-RA.1
MVRPGGADKFKRESRVEGKRSQKDDDSKLRKGNDDTGVCAVFKVLTPICLGIIVASLIFRPFMETPGSSNHHIWKRPPEGEKVKMIDMTDLVNTSVGLGSCVTTRPSRRQGFAECKMDGVIYPMGGNRMGPWLSLMKPPSLHRMAHASNVISFPNGDLLCVWFSGTEGSDDVAIVSSRMHRGQLEWSFPARVSKSRDRSAQNPTMYYDPETGIVHLYHSSQAAYAGQATADVRHVQSHDFGRTWSQPEVVFTEKGAFVRNQFLFGLNKDVLLPMYYTPGGYGDFASHYSTLRRSTDRGLTWTEVHLTEPGDMLAQPTIVRREEGSPQLVAFFRSRNGDFIHRSTSDDDGLTWTKAKPIKLPSNNSGIQATLLVSGVIALVFNNMNGGWDAPRYPLAIALSEDGGESWPFVRDIEPGTGDAEYSYPSITQTADGLIHVTYTYERATIKYVCFSEDWVRVGGTMGVYQADGEDGSSSSSEDGEEDAEKAGGGASGTKGKEVEKEEEEAAIAGEVEDKRTEVLEKERLTDLEIAKRLDEGEAVIPGGDVALGGEDKDVEVAEDAGVVAEDAGMPAEDDLAGTSGDAGGEIMSRVALSPWVGERLLVEERTLT